MSRCEGKSFQQTVDNVMELIDAVNELNLKVCRLETALGELSYRTSDTTMIGGATSPALSGGSI